MNNSIILKQKNINKCWKCNKKLHLVGVMCKCKYYFCPLHRYPEEHNCTVDYKQFYKEILQKKSVKCHGDKIDKI